MGFMYYDIEAFESELKSIVHVAGLKMDYFLRQNDDILDNYMARHYISVIRMLADCM